jgi:pimeloyl-ACP methyl ester carboxylesterase
MSEFVDQHVVADGHRLRVRWFAPRRRSDDDVIVLLHQGLGSVSQWRAFPQALSATGCAVVGYDRWGHGSSDALTLPRGRDFLDAEAQRALPDVLQALGIERPILYGHSDGGTIALMFAAAYPDRPRAVISEAAHVFSEADSSGGLRQVVEEYRQGDLRARLAKHHGDNVDAMFEGWAGFWLRPDMRGWRMTDRLPAIRCPVLVVQGQDDDHGTLAQAETIAALAGGAVETFIVPGCGHAPHLEATDAVSARAGEFVRRLVTDG